MRQEATGVAARIALATLGHLVLLKIVQEFTGFSLFATIVQPVAAHDPAMNGLEGMPFLRVVSGDSLEFKFGQAVHFAMKQRAGFWFLDGSCDAVHIGDDRRNVGS
jgi:hypothetical protein